MTSKPLIVSLLGALALAGWLMVPSQSVGQTAAADQSAIIDELLSQQAVLLEKQFLIDEKLAAVAENVRVARLFAARSGGGK